MERAGSGQPATPITRAGTRFCPGTQGGTEFSPVAYSSASNMLYVASIDWCSTIKLARDDGAPFTLTSMDLSTIWSSVYSVTGLNRAVRWTFQPRADAEHFSVALASMVRKYVR